MSNLDEIFQCTQCGFCCHGETTVSLDEDDQRRMIGALEKHGDEVAAKFWRITGSIVQMKTVQGHCIFYDDGCTVYHGRPWRCKQWPLVPALLEDENNFIEAALGAYKDAIAQQGRLSVEKPLDAAATLIEAGFTDAAFRADIVSL